MKIVIASCYWRRISEYGWRNEWRGWFALGGGV